MLSLTLYTTYSHTFIALTTTATLTIIVTLSTIGAMPEICGSRIVDYSSQGTQLVSYFIDSESVKSESVAYINNLAWMRPWSITRLLALSQLRGLENSRITNK